MKKTTMMFALLALAMPPAVHAQCAGGGSTQPTLGIYLVECDCTVGSPNADAWQFRTPPKIVSIAAGSAAEGVLREGDVILQVGGRAITTADGAVAFARARTAGSTRMLIQRDGRTQTVTLRPTEMCPNAARIIAVAPGTLRRYQATPLPVTSGVTPSAVATATVQGAPVVSERVPLRAATVQGAPGVAVVAPTAPGVSTWIGIAFSCSDCTADPRNGRWIFRSAPEVYSVESGSPAYTGGLRRGDVLTHVDGISITSDAGGRRWAQMKPGEAVRVNYTRAGTPRVATIRPGQPRVAVPLTSAAAATTYRAAVESNAVATLREYERLIQEQNARERATMQQLLQRELGDSVSRRELETVLRAYATQQDAMQREREARTQELMRSLHERGAIDSTKWTQWVVGAPRPAAAQRLRFSGAIGGAEVEVRGSNSVVVTENSDEIIITTSDATIRVRVPKREQ